MTTVTTAAHLAVSDLVVEYRTTGRALHGVSLAVGPGAVVAILGPNGAGKTTLVRAISGLLPIHKGRLVSGQVELEGRQTGKLDARAIVRSGVGQVPEGRLIFGRLTVAENLMCGAATRQSKQEVLADLAANWELFPSLYPRRDAQAGLLSGGEQQMVAVGRALMARPRLLICDEVTLGLAPKFVLGLFDALRTINSERRTSMLLVEQNAEVALDFATHAYVLSGGEVTAHGSADEIRASSAVHESYLGSAGAS